MRRLFIIFSISISIAAGVFFVWTATHNPMVERASVFDDELAAISPAPAEYSTDTGLDYDQIYADVEGKSALWNELVVALPRPKPKPKAVKKPNMAKLLQGVSPGRNQVGSKVQIKTSTNRRGSYLGVGDQINGMAILEITRTEVVFGLTQNGKEYTHTLPRR